ncbi:MAG TPA: hypothetical protein VJQ82_21905 [Terriglobales bacterium]|nr:hypothetical protein [Terriglobales bacterium]
MSVSSQLDNGAAPISASAADFSPPSPILPLPSRSGWDERLKKACSFFVVLTLLVLVVVFTMARGSIQDPDIWWHLHNADYLFQHHSLPRVDMYSFTVPGHAWVNHEWLAEIPYYLAWRRFGLSGIQAVMLFVLGLIFLGVLYLSYRESGNYKAAVAATCYSVFLASVSFGPRTILFGYAYMVGLLLIMQRLRQKGSAPLWILPPLFCLWVNTHGSWLIGLVVFSVLTAAGFVKGRWGSIESVRWTPRQIRNLVLAWTASVAALFLNPFGSRLVFYPFDLAFRQKLNVEHVEEWVSVNFHDTRGKLVLALLIVLLLSALLRVSRWTLAELGLILFALYSGLTYIRFLFLIGIIVAPILAKMLDFMPPYRAEKDTPVLNACVIVLMIAGVVHYWPTGTQLQSSLADQYPVQAFDYLEAHPPQGPMLNFYLWGGYLNWRDPQLKIFIDSRVDIFEYEGVLKDYLDILALDHPEALLDKYKIRYVLFPRAEPLTYVLQHDPKWKLRYNDKLSFLFERTEGSAETASDGRSTPP